jgi:hypothetical protein
MNTSADNAGFHLVFVIRNKAKVAGMQINIATADVWRNMTGH